LEKAAPCPIIAALLNTQDIDEPLRHLSIAKIRDALGTAFSNKLKGGKTINSDYKMLVVFSGLGVIGLGVLMINNAFSHTWTLETVPTCLAETIAGGFISIIGLVIIGAVLNVLDDMGGIVEDIWDRFLHALGR